MKKKLYQTPTIKVVVIRQRPSLLAGSLQTTGLDGLYWGEVSDIDDEAD